MYEQFKTDDGYIVGKTLATRNGIHKIQVQIDEHGRKVNYDTFLPYNARVVPQTISTSVVFANTTDERLISSDNITDLNTPFVSYGSGVKCSPVKRENSILLVLSNPYLLYDVHQLSSLIRLCNLMREVAKEYLSTDVINKEKYMCCLNLANSCFYVAGWAEIEIEFLGRAFHRFVSDWRNDVVPIPQPINYLFDEIKVDGIYSIIDHQDTSVFFKPSVNLPVFRI